MPTAMKLYLGRECLGGTGDSPWVGCRWWMTQDQAGLRVHGTKTTWCASMIREDRTVTVRMLADALHINKSTCHQILREDLGKRKLSARLVLHALTEDRKEVRASICADLLHDAQNDATFVNSIIAEDESWCFQYDPQTKRQSAEWRSTGTSPSKKVRRSHRQQR